MSINALLVFNPTVMHVSFLFFSMRTCRRKKEKTRLIQLSPRSFLSTILKSLPMVRWHRSSSWCAGSRRHGGGSRCQGPILTRWGHIHLSVELSRTRRSHGACSRSWRVHPQGRHHSRTWRCHSHLTGAGRIYPHGLLHGARRRHSHRTLPWPGTSHPPRTAWPWTLHPHGHLHLLSKARSLGRVLAWSLHASH